MLKNSTIFGLIAGGFLVFMTLFSFLHYVTVGKYKDLHYVTVGKYKEKLSNDSSNSSVAKSAKEWRNIKLSVEDSFKLAGNNIVAILDNPSAGRITFVAGTDEQFTPGGGIQLHMVQKGSDVGNIFSNLTWDKIPMLSYSLQKINESVSKCLNLADYP